MKLEPKFGQIIHKIKPTYYNTATPRLQLIHQDSNLCTGQSLHTATQLLKGSSAVRAKIWANYTQKKAYILQHSYSKTPVKLEPKFGQFILKTKPTYYNTATPFHSVPISRHCSGSNTENVCLSIFFMDFTINIFLCCSAYHNNYDR